MKKSTNITELFFNEPTKHWHFENILKEANISRPQALQWLKHFTKKKIIKRVKPKGKMPYYISNINTLSYQNQKKLYALQRLYSSGLMEHIQKIPEIKTAAIFGSFSRWDWYKQSDIDLFIYGEDNLFEQGKYEVRLKREIQTFTVKTERDLKLLQPGLLKNIISGYLIKGSFNFLEYHITKVGHTSKLGHS